MMQAFPLSTFGLYDYVRLTGADAIGFLQGQSSCDTQKLAPQRCLPGALCNIKGRVIADFRLLQMTDESLLLQTSAGMGQKIIDTLARYAVFSRVELHLTNGPEAVFGIIGDPSTETQASFLPVPADKMYTVQHSNDYTAIRLPGDEPRHEFWCHTSEAAARLIQLGNLEILSEKSAWERQDILAGVVHVLPETSELYTPQLLNYDLSGVIDFKKGCYTGQEVVARMYYRSKAKKRLFLLRSNQNLAEIEMAEAEVLAAVSAEKPEQDSVALGIVNTSLAAANPTLILSTGQSKVSLHEINYNDSRQRDRK